MKTTHWLLLLALIPCSLQAQVWQQGFEPAIWLRAADCGSQPAVWSDLSGQGHHALLLDSVPPDTVQFNYHPAFLLDLSRPGFKIPYLPNPNGKYTYITVYRSADSATEQGIWNIRLDSVQTAGLTTQNLKSFSRKVPFAPVTSTTPVINALFQSWLNRQADTANCFLLVGANDTLGFTGKLAEFLLFDKRLTDKVNARVHTVLALRYGITLYEMPYVAGNDTIIWSWDTEAEYHYEVAGIGSDTLLGICQKQSAGDGGDAAVAIAAGILHPAHNLNPATMPQGCFLVWGHNHKALAPIIPDTLPGAAPFIPGCMQRVWLVRATGNGAAALPTQVVYRPQPTDTLPVTTLVIDRQALGIFHPDSVEFFYPDSVDAAGNVYFNAILWDTDLSGSDAFTFLFPWQQQQSTAKKTNLTLTSGHDTPAEGLTAENESPIQCRLYPNPTPNHYHLVIELPETADARVTLADATGKQMAEYRLSGSNRYTIEGSLQNKGLYLVTVYHKGKVDGYRLLVY